LAFLQPFPFPSAAPYTALAYPVRVQVAPEAATVAPQTLSGMGSLSWAHGVLSAPEAAGEFLVAP